jgi:UV DNA damage endonuclease
MLGLVCHFIEEQKKKNGETVFHNKFETKTLQLGRYKSGKYSEEQIKQTYIHNVQKTLEILPKVVNSGIFLFRLTSNLFPLYDLVPRGCWDNDEVKSTLKSIGQFITMHKMRICVHPGQFCVLSSDSDDVVHKAFVELETHAWMFDEMGLDTSPKYAINIHGGKADRTSRLIDQIKSLPSNVRNRLTLENDECSYNVMDLLPVYSETKVPIVFDSHHHGFNDGELSMEDAMEITMETWPSGIKPLQHLSNTEPHLVNGNFQDRRKHSDMIHYVPPAQLQAMRDDTIDVEIEAKLKNLSVTAMRTTFDIKI